MANPVFVSPCWPFSKKYSIVPLYPPQSPTYRPEKECRSTDSCRRGSRLLTSDPPCVGRQNNAFFRVDLYMDESFPIFREKNLRGLTFTYLLFWIPNNFFNTRLLIYKPSEHKKQVG